MFNKENTVLIIGDSPYLADIEDKLAYLIERYPSLGINNIIRKYPTQIHIFQDMPFCALTNQYPDIKTVAPAVHGDLISKENKELIDSYTYNFFVNNSKDIYKNGRLAWCGFTHDYAISYCIHKGYENIILIGAADFTQGKHYMTDAEFSPSQVFSVNSKNFIEKACTQRANIYTCNSDSWLNVLRVSPDKLLD